MLSAPGLACSPPIRLDGVHLSAYRALGYKRSKEACEQLRKVSGMRIIDLDPDDGPVLEQAAKLLVQEFREHWPDAWPTMDAALKKVRDSFGPNCISRAAIDDDGQVVGWIGGTRQYRGKVWELDPLVVRSDCQRKGIGRALVADLERQAREGGGITLWVGTDDMNNMTSLGGADLYPNVLEHLSTIENLKEHPYEFYQKLGFTIVGVMPDANGLERPDIFMAKSLVRP